METGIEKFDGIKFLKQIESEELISKKCQIMNAVLDQESTHKNMKEEMRKKGVNVGSNYDYDYVPIEVVEEGLRQIFFRQIDFEIGQAWRDINSVMVTCSVKYKDPISGDFRRVDGIGAKALQQDKGSSVKDIDTTVKPNAFELGYPIAYTRAVKNAAKKIGKVFGANLNRDSELEGISMYSVVAKSKANPTDERILKLIESANTQEDLDFAKEHSGEKYLYFIKQKQIKINKNNN